MLSQPTTSSPECVNASARWLPRKPATPEMKTFICWLEGSSAPQDRRDRAEKDADIEPEGPLLNVLPVEEDDILEVDHLAASAHLPESGDPGLGVEAAEVVVLVFVEVRLEERSRSDQRHVADQYIGELWQLVETPATKKFSET